MPMNMNLTYWLEDYGRYYRAFYYSEGWGGIDRIVRTPLSQDIRLSLESVQEAADNITNDFIAEKEAAGWTFPDDFKWGIPPEDDD
jgi:hypothetical protein